MDQAAFKQLCEEEGFEPVMEREGEAGFTSNVHTHPFTARIMVLSGEFTLTREGKAEVYGAGGNFTMTPGCEHAESFGAEGATYLVARKH